jgi:hypothetical protein
MFESEREERSSGGRIGSGSAGAPSP